MVQKTDVGNQDAPGNTNQGDVFVLKPELAEPVKQPEARVGQPIDPPVPASSQAEIWKGRARQYWWVGALAGGLAAAAVTCLLVRRRPQQEPLAKVRSFLADHR
jgi:hypothetical protein